MILLVEDSIVRSTTMKVLLGKLYESGAREIHVRVACPPIVAPCYYGIDMSQINELFAPRFLGDKLILTDEIQQEMARELGCDSLRYLPLESIAAAIGFAATDLCQACISGEYPTPAGQRLYQLDVNGDTGRRPTGLRSRPVGSVIPSATTKSDLPDCLCGLLTKARAKPMLWPDQESAMRYGETFTRDSPGLYRYEQVIPPPVAGRNTKRG